jgi:hypothetical protein
MRFASRTRRVTKQVFIHSQKDFDLRVKEVGSRVRRQRPPPHSERGSEGTGRSGQAPAREGRSARKDRGLALVQRREWTYRKR